MLLLQFQQLLALLKQKKPPTILVVATVLAIAASVLVQWAGLTAPASTTTVIVQAPQPAAVKAAERIAQTLPVTCNPPPNAALGACAPRGALAAVAASARLAGAASVQVVHGSLCADVSSNNAHPIDWRAAAHELACGFVKVSEGPTGHGPYVNPYAAGDCSALKANGRARAGYDFARPQTGWTGTDEAHWFYVHAGPCLGSLPSVLDVEASLLSPSATHHWVAQYVAEIRHLSGRFDFIIYTGAWFWDPHVGGSNLGTYLWVSGYASSPVNPRSWRVHLCWQFTDGGYGPYPHTIAGIGHVDVSVCDAKLLVKLNAAHHASPAAERRAAALRKAKRSHRLVHRKIHQRCRGHHIDHHSAGCRLLFAENARLHHRWGKSLVK